MGDKSKIEWTDATWNPIRGCSRVSEGCRNCYAERQAARFGGKGQPYEGTINYRSQVSGLTYTNRGAAGSAVGSWNGTIKVIEEHLTDPLRWKKPRRIFVNSMSDLFHENLADETIDRIFAVMALCPQHTFQVLTKRAERMVAWFARSTTHAEVSAFCLTNFDRCMIGTRWPLPNVWLGVSVENQAAADERIPHLLRTPAAVRWLSVEPMLGPVKFWCPYPGPVIDWVVCGGESGAGARPMHPDWARSLRDQCVAAGVPFFFKQWGEFAPSDMAVGVPELRVGKKRAGRTLDDMEWSEYPAVRESEARA